MMVFSVDNQFEICEKIFDIEIETNDKKKASYVIDEEKVKELIKQNNDKEIFRYIKDYDEKYILSIYGGLFRYDERLEKYIKVKLTQEKNGVLITKLRSFDGKRKTARLNLLMKETFPEVITYNKEIVGEIKKEQQKNAANAQIKGDALIKCYNEITNENNYYMTIHKAAVIENISEEIIIKILKGEMRSIGGKHFYYN